MRSSGHKRCPKPGELSYNAHFLEDLFTFSLNLGVCSEDPRSGRLTASVCELFCVQTQIGTSGFAGSEMLSCQALNPEVFLSFLALSTLFQLVINPAQAELVQWALGQCQTDNRKVFEMDILT